MKQITYGAIRTVDNALGARLRRLAGALALAAGALAAASVAPGAASAADRVAIILSAENYKAYPASPLDATRIDAVAGALKALEFEVEIVRNATNATSRASLRGFVGSAQGAEIAVVVLAGHVAASRGGSFFLPSNVEIRRATDLLSRGVSVAAVAQAAARADQGAVFFLTTTADLPSTLQGVNARPQLTTSPSDNVVIAFSSSNRIPVSQMNVVARRAAIDLADAALEPEPTLAALVDAVSAGGVGLVAGEIADFSFAPPPPEVTIASAETGDAATGGEAATVETGGQVETSAETGDGAATEPAATETTPIDAGGGETALAGQTEAGDATTAETGGEITTDSGAGQSAVAAPPIDPDLAAVMAMLTEADAGDVESLQLVEALLGRPQKRNIQQRLVDLELYRGRVDAIFGRRTRNAIKAFQKSRGEPETGYLTVTQISVLIAAPSQ